VSSTTATGAVAGTSASGTIPGGKGDPKGSGGSDGKNVGGGSGSAAASAQEAAGSLPFTGMHAPLLIVVGLGMAAAGLVIRRRLGDAE
jgi:hypothetical protein